VPLPPVRMNPDLPPDLERVIEKALEKDRDLRYQHASDIRTDLKRLKREIESSKSGFLVADDVQRAAPAATTSNSTQVKESSGRTAAASGVRESSGGMAASAPQAAVAAPAAALRWRIVIPAVVVAAALIGGFFFWRLHRAPALTEKDTIALADFVNKTGDPVFDDTLKQGLAVDLGQSPFLERELSFSHAR
jgi:hypothetical protein